LRIPRLLENQFRDGGDVVSLKAPAALHPPGSILVLISVRGSANPRAIVPPEVLDNLELLMISSGIEPDTSQLLGFRKEN
jgi:hypothetical protein